MSGRSKQGKSLNLIEHTGNKKRQFSILLLRYSGGSSVSNNDRLFIFSSGMKLNLHELPGISEMKTSLKKQSQCKGIY